MFPVSGHSAERVQQDIATILNAIASWFAKVKLQLPPSENEDPLPPVQWRAELEQEPCLDLEVLPEMPVLTGTDPKLLKGQDWLLPGESSSKLLLTPVQVQIGDTHIAGLLPEVRDRLEKLPPDQIASLRQAIEQTTPTSSTDNPVIVAVDGVQVLHRDEPGLLQVNELQPLIETDQDAIESELEAEVIDVRETTRNVVAVPPEAPHLELRPVEEVEVLVGQTLTDSSVIHNQVIQQAPAVLISVDEQGKVKPGSYLRDHVEATEDSVEAEIATENQIQPLTPAAIAIVTQLKKYFETTGDPKLCCQDYTFQRVGNQLFILSNESSDNSAVIQDNQIQVDSKHYSELMERFAKTFEKIQASRNEERYEQNHEYDLA